MANVDADVAMFRPRPEIGLGRAWHVFDKPLNGFALVAPCGFVQAGLYCERTSTSRVRLLTGDAAVLERRLCRLCLAAVRKAG
jgi:hypothetical protein